MSELGPTSLTSPFGAVSWHSQSQRGTRTTPENVSSPPSEAAYALPLALLATGHCAGLIMGLVSQTFPRFESTDKLSTAAFIRGSSGEINLSPFDGLTVPESGLAIVFRRTTPTE